MSDSDTDPSWFNYTLGFIFAVAALIFILLDSTDAYNFNEYLVGAILASMLLLVGMGPMIRRIVEARYGE